MQSGMGKTDKWILEYETKNPTNNPLMGWESSSDTLTELKLEFSSKELAINYAKNNKINYEIIEPKKEKQLKNRMQITFKLDLCLNFLQIKNVFMEYWRMILLILAATWYQVQLDVRINEWFGEFYDTLQKALAEPGAVTEKEFIAYLFTFAKIAAVYILVVIFSDYFTSHWTFRWRTAMADFYHDKWNFASSIEGASHGVQEDTLKFARIMEGLGAVLRSVMTLIAFTPILWVRSKSITVLPWIGEVNHALLWVAIISALGGTFILAAVGIKLPGIEYDIQKEEAAYRKELVLGEDFKENAQPFRPLINYMVV